MKIENQVASLEPSKRLVELGLKVESLWSQSVWDGKPHVIIPTNEVRHTKRHWYVPALTVAELGEMLPDDELLRTVPDEIIDPEGGDDALIRRLLTTPDILARTLIWLIDEKILTVEELNNA